MPAEAVYVISRFHTSCGHQIIYDSEALAPCSNRSASRISAPAKWGGEHAPRPCRCGSPFQIRPRRRIQQVGNHDLGGDEIKGRGTPAFDHLYD